MADAADWMRVYFGHVRGVHRVCNAIVMRLTGSPRSKTCRLLKIKRSVDVDLYSLVFLYSIELQFVESGPAHPKTQENT